MITVKELSKLMNVRSRNIQAFINFGRDAENWFIKMPVPHPERARGGKTITKNRPMWCIDEKKIDAFIEFWQKRSKGRKLISNGLTTQDRLTWTEFARECYEAKCRCSKCNNNKTCSEIEKITHERKMKNTVIKLVRELGIPPERII